MTPYTAAGRGLVGQNHFMVINAATTRYRQTQTSVNFFGTIITSPRKRLQFSFLEIWRLQSHSQRGVKRTVLLNVVLYLVRIIPIIVKDFFETLFILVTA